MIPGRQRPPRTVPGRESRDVGAALLSALTFLTGLWLLLAPTVLGYRTHDRAAAWSAAGTGFAVALVSLLQTASPVPLTGPAWLLAALGAWSALAPSVLRHDSGRATANDLLAGFLVLTAATALHRAARRRSAGRRS